MKFLSLCALSLGALLLVNLRETSGEIAVGCTQKSADIVISLDDSSSISSNIKSGATKSEWEQQIDFAVKFVDKVSQAFLEPRFAINVWADYTYRRPLELSTDAENAKFILRNIVRVATGTPTDAGFAAAKLQFELEKDNGGRDRLMVLITDGMPSQSITDRSCMHECAREAAIAAATDFKSLNIPVYTVGVGVMDDSDLRAMASTPTEKFSFLAADFSAIDDVLGSLVDGLCFYPKSLSALCVGAQSTNKYIDVIGKNLVDMGKQMQCELKLGYDGTPKIVDATIPNRSYGTDTAFRCPVDLGPGSEDERVYVEVSRDGEAWSANSLSFTYRDDCSYRQTRTESPTPTPVTEDPGGVTTGCSAKNMDIVLVVDDSGSIANDQWDLQVDFVADFITKTNQDFGDVRFSLVLFGLTDRERDSPFAIDNSKWAAQIKHDLATLNDFDLIKALKDHRHNKGWTPMDLGFKLAHEVLSKPGLRTDAERLVLLVTDGVPTTCPTVFSGKAGRADTALCLQAARDQNKPLKDDGILVMTVGVGLAPDRKKDMINFATKPASMFALPDVGDFEALSQALPKLIDAMCFYVDDVDDKVCEGGSFTVTGKNLIDLGNTWCSFQQQGTDNGEVYEVLFKKGEHQGKSDKPGYHEVVCSLPEWLDDANVTKWQNNTDIYVEVARDGRDYTSNNKRVRYSEDCSSNKGSTGGGDTGGGTGGNTGGGTGGYTNYTNSTGGGTGGGTGGSTGGGTSGGTGGGTGGDTGGGTGGGTGGSTGANIAPTKAPTSAPTKAPTNAPTKAPTSAPTKAPTNAPTKAPTSAPTEAPTNAPTKAPTSVPTKAPNAPTAPTSAPTTTIGASCTTTVSAAILGFVGSFAVLLA